MTTTLWRVVKFVSDNSEEESIETVPSSWIRDDEEVCYWPPFSNKKDLEKAIKSAWSPNPNWKKYIPGSNDSSKCLCCPVHSEVYLQQAIKKINLVQASINQLAKDMQELKKQNMFTEVNHQKPNESLFIKQNLPATTKETLNHLEDYLNNVDNFERAVSELHLIGGATLYDFVKRMLSGLITDKLAAQFSFYGLRTKEKFSQLKVSELIIRCAKHGNFKETTTKDVEDCIKKWLRRAKERNDSYIKRKDEGNNSLQN
ncbi:hypothetical protein RI129_002748 [Pyrocoelia pectoralis]|uniref:DUF4806 domain-containing protein n=1 Tax=Pyrocoelia pectoralis TaxID=417401 RepID=A0AAN7ZTL5_9COLE